MQQNDYRLVEAKRWGTKDGMYGFLKTVGEGSFGAVFLAKRRLFEPLFAVTLLNTDTIGLVNLEPFEEMLTFSHDNIVTILDCYLCYDPPGSYMRKSKKPVALGLVMKYCLTEDLCKYLKCYTVSEATRLRWYSQLLRGLQFLHSRSITHGDLNPQNVWIEDDNLKLAYAGIAETAWKKKAPDVPFGEFMSGFHYSAPYVPPEAWTGANELHEHGDVFTLGLTFLAISEAPDNGFHHAQWNNKKTFLGTLLVSNTMSRSTPASHLLWPPVTNSSPYELKLINKMLKYNAKDRPDLDTLIEDFGQLKSRPTMFECNNWFTSCSC